jgi:hypothetical protein
MYFKMSFFVNALRAIVLWILCRSTDMDALRVIVSRRERISIEKAGLILAFVRRTLTDDNLKCTQTG